MNVFIFLLIMLSCALVGAQIYADPLPSCNVPTMYKMGYADFGTTLMNCSDVMPSPLSAPSYWPG